jgi:hypothetical protein
MKICYFAFFRPTYFSRSPFFNRTNNNYLSTKVLFIVISGWIDKGEDEIRKTNKYILDADKKRQNEEKDKQAYERN